ncbi:MAG: NusA N-terminal domain-containing protein [Planctomycetota bacterium]|jgi:N utilization substance protein A
MSQELIRIVDNIARDKNIDKESVFADLEEAMISAARKHFGEPESEIVVNIDRATGEITAFREGLQIDIKQLGRIPAQTAKQVMIQKIRADERDSIYTEFVQRKGTIVSGSVVRYESGSQSGPSCRGLYAEKRTNNGPDTSVRREDSLSDS